MDLKVLMLAMSMLFMTAGLFLASRLMNVSLAFWQALVAAIAMSVVSELFGPDKGAGLIAIVAAFLVSIVPLKLMTRESMWSTIKLSIVGTVIGAALLLSVIKIVFPIKIPLAGA